MKTLEQVLLMTELQLCREEVEECLNEDWIRPQQEGNEYQFEDIDIARLQLIGELRHRMEIHREAIPLILSLLDQLHDSRLRIQKLVSAIEHQPRSVQAEIFSLLIDS